MRRRRGYRSPAKRKRRRNRLILISVLGVALLGVGIKFALPSVTKYVSEAASGFKSGFRFPWQKKESQSPDITPILTSPRPELSVEQEEGITGEDYFGADFKNQGNNVIPTINPNTTTPKINIDLNVHDDSESVDVIQLLSYTNNSNEALNQIKLYFPKADLLTNPLAPFDRLVLNSTSILGAQSMQDDILTISSPDIIEIGESISLTLSYNIKLPAGNTIPGSSGGEFRLADYYFYPIEHQNGVWLDPLRRQAANFEVNCTFAGDKNIISSGIEKNKSNIRNDSARVLFSADGLRSFALLSYPQSFKSESVSAGSSLVFNAASETATVLRINELSKAIMTFYENRYGSLGRNVSVIESEITEDVFVQDSMIAYSKSMFGDEKEFRYQLAFALARQFFPNNSGKDEQSDLLNTLLCTELASAYIVSSQGENQSAYAYNHMPLSKNLADLRGTMDENAFDTAVKQYLTYGNASYFDSAVLFNGLPYEIANQMTVMITDYMDSQNFLNPEN